MTRVTISILDKLMSNVKERHQISSSNLDEVLGILIPQYKLTSASQLTLVYQIHCILI